MIIGITLFLYAIAYILMMVSAHDGAIFLCLLLLAMGGLLLSVLFAPWTKGLWKERLKRGMRLGFPLSGLLFISGYFYVMVLTWAAGS